MIESAIAAGLAILVCGGVIVYLISATGTYTAKKREFYTDELFPLVQGMRLLHAQDLEMLRLLASEAAMGRSPAALLDLEGQVDVSGHRLLDIEAFRLLTDPRCEGSDRDLLAAVRYYFDFGRTPAPNGWMPGKEAIAEVRTLSVYDYIRAFEKDLHQQHLLAGRKQIVSTCIAELKRRIEHIEELCDLVRCRRGIADAAFAAAPQEAAK